MKNKDKQPEPAASLRRRAEEITRGKASRLQENLGALSPEETRQTLHELRVYQIELEMQNEELRRAQVELDAARERYFDLYDLAPVGYCTLNEQGLILEANLTAADLLGLARDTLVQQPISRFILKEDQDIFYLHCKHLFETGSTQVCELRMKHLNGTPMWVRIDATIVRDADGIPECRTVISDITERKRAEIVQQIQFDIARKVVLADTLKQLLETVRVELSRLLDTTNFFVALYNRETDTLKQVLYKDQREQFVEWKSGNSLSGQVIHEAKTLLLKKPEIIDFAVERNLTLLGTLAECWLGVPLIIEKQAIGAMVIQSYTDPDAYDRTSSDLMEMVAHELSLYIEKRKMIDDLIVAKKNAEESDRLKSAFLANMSHEIRTPLNSIIGFSDLLSEEDNDTANVIKYSTIIKTSGNRLLQLISDIIDISKIESGTEPVRNSIFSPVNAIWEVMNQFQYLAESKSIQIIERIPPEFIDLMIHTDSLKLHQILTNLLNNALKFTKDGFIELGLEKSSNGTLFFVKDTGIGIHPDQLDQVFYRFYQVDTSATRLTQGAGLGLSLCKGMVELLGGKIRVESEVGKGSKFEFILPDAPVS